MVDKKHMQCNDDSCLNDPLILAQKLHLASDCNSLKGSCCIPIGPTARLAK